MKFKEGRLYYIEWKDHNTLDGTWHALEDLKKSTEVVVIESLGWCVVDTPDVVCVASEKSKSGYFGGVLNIIKSDIINVWEIMFEG